MAKEAQREVLYRQYRPSKWSEVRGQPQVTDTLQATVKNKKIAHAYLFCGGRGTGKTTVARILAQSLGVTDKDLYEIDAASKTGVDDIRELREGADTVPFESPYKFYIIDEAHMLSRNAWNALLKTLEEPPAHVIFVLATTDRDKVPDTIQSRCEVHVFKQPSRELLAETVVDIGKSEGYGIEKPAAELVALLAEGSFRDALSILQKVLAVSKDKKIDVSEVEVVSGAPRGEMVRRLLAAISKKDAGAGIRVIHEAVEANMDMRLLARLLIHRLRVLLLMRFASDLADELSAELTEADVESMHSLVKDSSVTSDTLRVILEAHAAMAYATLPNLPLELALIDIAGKA